MPSDEEGAQDEMAVMTADAAVFTRDDNDEMRVLMVLRGWPPHEGMWALPGGKLNAGERDRDAAIRETLEETSVDLSAIPLHEVKVYREPMRDARGRYVSCLWTVSLETMQPAFGGDDAVKAAWVRVDEALDKRDEIAFDHEDMIRDALQVLSVEIPAS